MEYFRYYPPDDITSRLNNGWIVEFYQLNNSGEKQTNCKNSDPGADPSKEEQPDPRYPKLLDDT
jgi:hypothetical protein